MRILLLMPLLLTLPARAAQLAGHKFLVTSVRTGDTETFIVNLQTGDAIKSPAVRARKTAILVGRPTAAGSPSSPTGTVRPTST